MPCAQPEWTVAQGDTHICPQRPPQTELPVEGMTFSGSEGTKHPAMVLIGALQGVPGGVLGSPSTPGNPLVVRLMLSTKCTLLPPTCSPRHTATSPQHGAHRS